MFPLKRLIIYRCISVFSIKMNLLLTLLWCLIRQLIVKWSDEISSHTINFKDYTDYTQNLNILIWAQAKQNRKLFQYYK